MIDTTKPNDGGPAFPAPARFDTEADSWDCDSHFTGMTLRDYFAAKAMQGFCANNAIFASNPRFGGGLVNCTEEQLAQLAVRMADAMLRARQESSHE